MWNETNTGNFYVDLASSRAGGIWVAANGRLRRFESGHWVATGVGGSERKMNTEASELRNTVAVTAPVKGLACLFGSVVPVYILATDLVPKS